MTQLSRRSWLGVAFIGLVTAAAYLPAFHSGFIWDDDIYVTKNLLLTAPDGLRRIWFSLDSPSQYFPLTYTTFRIEHALWGFNPAGYHAVNVLLHIANALLVWRLLSWLGVPGAWLAAGIFALHPVQVESVAWITERKNVLMAFFFLLALLAWFRFLERDDRRLWLWYALTLLFYALALSAKSTACTLPAALILMLWLRDKRIDRARLLQVIPFAILGCAMAFLAMWWERFHQGTRGADFEIGIIERVLIASRALVFYAGKLIWPFNLTFSYPRWNVSAANPIWYVWLVVEIALAVGLYRARRSDAGRAVGAGPAVAVLFFLTTLAPVIGFVMLYTFRYTFVADHYQYVASIGLIAIFAATISAAADRTILSRFKPALSLAILLALAALTYRQAGAYQNSETLWRDTLQKNPDSWLARNNLANLYVQTGRPDEAIAECRKALATKPDDAEAYFNLGVALSQKGQPNEAAGSFMRALELNPKYEEAHGNLALLLLRGGQRKEAESHFQKAREIQPLNPTIPNNLAWLLATSPDDSLRDGAKALELAQLANGLSGGREPSTLDTVAAAYAESGDYGAAVATAQQALAMARSNSDAQLAREIEDRLALYGHQRPYRQAPEQVSP